MSILDPRRRLGALFLLALALHSRPAAAQQVWVVEPAGNGHFRDIQPAIDAAGEGDLILIRPHVGRGFHSYRGFSIQGKALSVVGLDVPGHAFVILPPVEVRDLQRHQTVVLADLTIRSWTFGLGPGLMLVDCAGAVRASRCVLGLSLNSTSEALWVEGSANVALVDCEIEGGWLPAQAAAWSRSSRVALYRCEVEGGYGAGPGYLSGDSLLYAQEGRIRGSEGLWVHCGEVPNPGGPGAHLHGTAELFTASAQLIGGPGGWADGDWCPNPEQGPAGPELVLEDAATHTSWPVQSSHLEAPGLVFGDRFTVAVQGLPSERVWLLQGAAPGFELRPDLRGVALLEGTGPPRELGTIPSSGVLEAELELDPPHGGAEVLRRFFQVAFEDSGGQLRLSEPWTVLVASEAFGPPCGLPLVVDCNANGVPDLCDLESGASEDINENLVPDECEPRSLRIHVDADATGANDGTRWQDAFVSLRDALLFTQQLNPLHAEIWVAEGTYLPGPTTWDSFALQERVDWYGGFSGVEQSLDERDPSLYVTILSGDLNGDDGPGFTNYDDNSRTIVRPDSGGIGDATVIDGFVIRGGRGPAYWGGGGIYTGPSPGLTLRNCRVMENRAVVGGGAYVIAARVEDCAFTGNHAFERGGGAHVAAYGSFTRCVFADNESLGGEGGGLYIDGDCPLVDCSFERNIANAPFGHGGGLSSEEYNQRILRCRFVGNTAAGGGGAVHAERLGLEIEACAFLGNEAAEGGAIWARRSATVTNSLFSGNRAGSGGAVYAKAYGAEELRLSLSTFSENEALQLAGGVFLEPGRILVATNSILWGNRDSGGRGLAAQIHGLSPGAATYCCIQHDFVAPGGGSPARNLHLDPRFIDPLGPDATAGTSDDDLRLAAGSPCIDAGSNTAVPPGVTLDIADLPRFVDDPNVPDTGEGAAPLVDMGCHERQ
jgi:predicted outer membrane repeat protein